MSRLCRYRWTCAVCRADCFANVWFHPDLPAIPMGENRVGRASIDHVRDVRQLARRRLRERGSFGNGTSQSNQYHAVRSFLK